MALEKRNKNKIKPKEIIIKATSNLNKTPTVKYWLEPQYIERKKNH